MFGGGAFGQMAFAGAAGVSPIPAGVPSGQAGAVIPAIPVRT
jgi:hypothetical protein